MSKPLPAERFLIWGAWRGPLLAEFHMLVCMQWGWRSGGRRICVSLFVTPWVHWVLLVSCHCCVNVLPWLPRASARRPWCSQMLRGPPLLPVTNSSHLHPAPRRGTGTPCSFGACSLLSLQVLLLLTRTFSVSLLCHQRKLFHPWGLSAQAFPSQGRLPQGQLSFLRESLILAFLSFRVPHSAAVLCLMDQLINICLSSQEGGDMGIYIYHHISSLLSLPPILPIPPL